MNHVSKDVVNLALDHRWEYHMRQFDAELRWGRSLAATDLESAKDHYNRANVHLSICKVITEIKLEVVIS